MPTCAHSSTTECSICTLMCTIDHGHVALPRLTSIGSRPGGSKPRPCTYWNPEGGGAGRRAMKVQMCDRSRT
eukprot:7390152-Prymnesium_polylepis.1